VNVHELWRAIEYFKTNRIISVVFVGTVREKTFSKFPRTRSANGTATG